MAARDSTADGPARDGPMGLIRRVFGSERTAQWVLGGLLAFLVVTYVVVLAALKPEAPGRELTVDAVLRGARDGSISEVTLLAEDDRFIGVDDEGSWWLPTGDNAFFTNGVLGTLAENDVPTRVDDQYVKSLLRFASQVVLPALTLVVGFAFLFVLVRGSGGGDYSVLGRSGARRYAAEDTGRVTFDDVAGLQEAIEDLREVKDFLMAPERFEAMGARPPRGVLLSGPPGCGKTLLARAVAGEAHVPFFSISGSEFGGFLVGVGPARVRNLFAQAKAAAPSIIFIDELDAVGRARASGQTLNTEGEATLNELLVQLDGFEASSRVVLMAATNRPDILDQALIRKGRFDRHIVVDRPDYNARLRIARIHAQGKPLGRDVDIEEFARRTAGLNGADIAASLNEAAMLAARRNRNAIGMGELREGIERVVAGAERPSRILSDEEKQRVAVHEAGHVLVAWLSSSHRRIEKVTIVARGHSLGSTWDIPTEERRSRTRSEMAEELAYRLAGRAAEFVALGEPAGGAREDLTRATRLARQMVSELGMSEVVGARYVGSSNGERLPDERHSELVAERVDREVDRLLHEADERARDLLSAHREELDRLAGLLVEHETLERADLETVLADVTPEIDVARWSGPGG